MQFAKIFQGVPGSFLFGKFFAFADAASENFSVNQRCRLESSHMRGAVLAEFFVRNRVIRVALNNFLQLAFVIFRDAGNFHALEFVNHLSQNEIAGNFPAAFQINRADNGFKGVLKI